MSQSAHYPKQKQYDFEVYQDLHSDLFEKVCKALGVDPQSVSKEQKEEFFYVQFEEYVEVLKYEDVFDWDY